MPAPRSRSRLGLTPEAIVAAAAELLDEQGADGLTMRRVAERLGIGTMTLYGYFSDKDALLDAVIDAGGADVVPPVSDGDWKSSLRTLMLALHDQLVEHPFLIEIRLRRPIVSPQAMRWTETALTILERAGFTPARAAEAFRPLFVYTFGHAAFVPREDERGVVNRTRAAVLGLPADEYPRTTAAADELAQVLVAKESYELGLDLLLDGIENRMPKL